MGLLTISTFGGHGSTCTEHEPGCIEPSDRKLFYIALLLIAVGLSGHKESLESFLADQCSEAQRKAILRGKINPQDPTQQPTPEQTSDTKVMMCYLLFAKFLTVFVFPYIKPWSIRFLICAIYTLLTLIMFNGYWDSYEFVPPEGTTFGKFFRVFVSAASKLFYPIPRDAKELYETQPGDQVKYLLPHTDRLRCLDKAAIILPTQPLEEQQTNKWRLCTVTEVEDTKKMLRMIPVCMTLIFCGVVSAIGWTYFVEQLAHMYPKVWFLTISTGIILWCHEAPKEVCTRYYEVNVRNKMSSLTCISVSMIVAILCCITAAMVEKRRLGVVQEHDLVDKPQETVPMTMFWLLPQFVLLGTFRGLFKSGTESFFKQQFPESERSYLPSLIEALFGIGTICSVASVYLVGKVSERGGNKNWFQRDLNASRLDKYFWTLSWLMVINLILFRVAANWYQRDEREDLEGHVSDTRQGQVHQPLLTDDY